MVTITLTPNDTQWARIAHCLGKNFGYKDVNGALRDATVVEVQQILAAYISEIVRGVEEAEKLVSPLNLL